MYGAFIGDIVGSKYEFHNIKTKEFPLFSQGCDFTDDTVMTVAVAKAIMLSRREQFEKNEKGRGFQDFLVEIMQDFGRRYPHPTGAYGGSFANWLRQNNPKPYGSYGNGSAMRVSPCGLVAVTMEEAQALARASACVSHDHPEGVKGAEAVSAAIFLAKCGRKKEEIRAYINRHYYKLDFTLNSIRDSYQFDGSCQGSVPQAITAFLESESFEDAIRNVISIGGDCDTTGAITGSIAWVYYAVQTGHFSAKPSPSMIEIKRKAQTYLPKEFMDIADEFHEVCKSRAGTYNRVGGCTSILNQDEWKRYLDDWGKSIDRKIRNPSRRITKELRETMTDFCNKYIVLMEVLYRDRELNQWCRNYSAYKKCTEHCELEKIIYKGFMREAYKLGFMPEILSWKQSPVPLESILSGTEEDLIYGICLKIRGDYGCNGSLIYDAIAKGDLYHLMRAFLSYLRFPRYTLEYIQAQKSKSEVKAPGATHVWHDEPMRKWRLRVQLDQNCLWYLSVFVRDDGSFEKYALDEESASDSHYEFLDEGSIRNSLSISGYEDRYFHEVLIQYVNDHGGKALLKQIYHHITAQFHYD